MRKKDVIILLIIFVVAFFAYNRYLHKSKAISVLENSEENALGMLKTVSSEKDYDTKTEETEKLYRSRENAITRAVEKVEPAVVSVNIIKTQIIRRYINPFDNPFFGFFDNVPYKREVQGIGSGVIFTEDGYIITNAHVVEGATKIKIVLSDSRSFDGKIIGIDSVHDIAVLKIDGKNLPYAELGTSKDLIIGEWAVAVGNPYGFLIKDSKPSVAVGVISAVNRDFAENKDGKIYRGMIQTDAAINPGNSGGPLVNINGEVIGINTFILSESGGSIGIGFAIPIDKVKKLAKELIEHGKVRDIWYGFKVQDINPLLANYMNLDSTDGVMVAYVEKGSPVSKAGLKKGDVIVGINDIPVKNTSDAELAISDVAVGDTIRLKVKRGRKILEISYPAVEYR